MKPYSILIVILFFALLAFAEEDKIVPIDFSSLQNPDSAKSLKKIQNSLDGISEGEFFRIRIDGINLNVWDVSINTADTTLSKEQHTPTFKDAQLETISEAIKGIGSLGTSYSRTTFLNIMTTNDAELDSILLVYKKLILESQLLEITETELKELAIKIDDLKFSIIKKQLYASSPVNDTTAIYEQSINTIIAIRKDLLQTRLLIIKGKTAYQEKISKPNEAVISKNDSLKSMDKTIQANYKTLTNNVDTLLASVSAEKSYELLSGLALSEYNRKSTYLSLPIQFRGEQTKIKLNIKPRNPEYPLNSYQAVYYLPAKIQLYNVIGVSFYGSNLYDEAYSIITEQTTDTSSVYHIVKESGDKTELGMAALFRMGKKLGSPDWLGFHINVGAGLSIAHTVKPRILTGAGLTVGSKHMLAVDAGYITGYVDRLSSSIDTSQPLTSKPEIVTVSKLKHGFYLSVGYTYQF